MLTKRKIKTANQADQTPTQDTPIPPKLTVRIKKVFLGPKHLREMQPRNSDLQLGKHWDWKLWVDAAGHEYASVKHGRNVVWYSVERLVPEGGSVDILIGPDTIPEGMRICIYYR